ncbi:NAD(+) diphosphatase [Acidocella sp.]|uniref:NAD(+) diphosphatase n=2 Tax=Acidocella sp. TaxID=50710 RepID=UPI00262E9F38|nr:NAD(+) diphosphatase [Acidocella sp.]
MNNTANHYAGGQERAALLREDETWQAAARARPDARAIGLWRGQVLVVGDDAAPQAARLALRPEWDETLVFLGVEADAPLFAVDLSAHEAAPNYGAGAYYELRGIGARLPGQDAGWCATARGLFNWWASHKFCPACGAGLRRVRAGWVLQCASCDREHFPRTDSAVIMLVVKGERVLLGQAHKFPPERNMYSTLAGFVEPGESLEDAVRREVAEEVGVRVGKVHYRSSQPWPFPASLMLGFVAQAESEEITLEETEMRDAKWFTRADLEAHAALGFSLPPKDSIARRLIDEWLTSA